MIALRSRLSRTSPTINRETWSLGTKSRRQKQRLIDIPGAKVLAHSPSLNQTRWDLNSDYSDRLLGAPKSSKSVMLPRINSPAAAMESAARPIWALQAVGGAGKLRNIR